MYDRGEDVEAVVVKEVVLRLSGQNLLMCPGLLQLKHSPFFLLISLWLLCRHPLRLDLDVECSIIFLVLLLLSLELFLVFIPRYVAFS